MRQGPDRLNTAIRTRDAHTALEALLPNAYWSKADCAGHTADARIQDQQSSRNAHLNDNQRSCCAYLLAFESSIRALHTFYALSSRRAEMLLLSASSVFKCQLPSGFKTLLGFDERETIGFRFRVASTFSIRHQSGIEKVAVWLFDCTLTGDLTFSSHEPRRSSGQGFYPFKSPGALPEIS
jgi:hypothetical protein